MLAVNMLVKWKNDEETSIHKENTEGFIKGIISRLENNIVHIFPLSQIPLLI